MKLQLKALVAALGIALAGGAHATIANSATGNGELFFTIWDNNGTDDTADDRAYVRDLGFGSLVNGNGTVGGLMNDWTNGNVTTSPAPTLSSNKFLPPVGPAPIGSAIFTVGADANLTSFLAGTTNLSGLRWNIAAADSVGTDRVLVTAAGIATPPTYTEFRQMGQGGIDGFLGTGSVNVALGANESVLLVGANAQINLWGDNLGGKATFSTSGGVGDALNFYLLSEKATTGSTTRATVQQFEQWTLQTDGTLIYAPVPEPGTWAMLAAGLLMVGGIARRRLSV